LESSWPARSTAERKNQSQRSFSVARSERPVRAGHVRAKLKITYLSPKCPVVTETEIERLVRELGEFYANTQRAQRDAKTAAAAELRS
jgi:hypothetical protein